MADAHGLLDVAAAAAGGPGGGTIVVPMRGKTIDVGALTERKRAMLRATRAEGAEAARNWMAQERGRKQYKGLVVVQGKFQPTTFGHELLHYFAKGFAETAGWPLEFAIFPISAASLAKQQAEGTFKTLTPAGSRIRGAGGFEPRALGGGGPGDRKRKADDNCGKLCGRFFQRRAGHICPPDGPNAINHIVLIVGTDAAAAERSENDCLSVIPFGEDRPADIPSAEALRVASAAIATGQPVPISATLVRKAALAGRQDILTVTRPMDEGRALLHDQYLPQYVRTNKQRRDAPSTCPFCDEELPTKKGAVIKSKCAAHFKTCPGAPENVGAGGGRRRTRRKAGRSRSRRRATRKRTPRSRRAVSKRRVHRSRQRRT